MPNLVKIQINRKIHINEQLKEKMNGLNIIKYTSYFENHFIT